MLLNAKRYTLSPYIMIIFAGIVPHSPSLIPSISGDKIKTAKKTVTAITDLEKKLYLTHPDTLLVLSPHGKAVSGNASIYLDETHECTLREVGDYSTKITCQPDIELIEKLRHRAISEGIKMTLKTVKDLDYGIVVPLYYLTKHLKKVKVIAINSHIDGLKENYNLGKILKEELVKTNRRVAILTSTDLAHSALTYSAEKVKAFDITLVKLIENNNLTGLLNLEKSDLENAKPCGLALLLLMLGMLDGMAYSAQNYSHESPFGIGYLVTYFKLP